jgi:hypothetical protein
MNYIGIKAPETLQSDLYSTSLTSSQEGVDNTPLHTSGVESISASRLVSFPDSESEPSDMYDSAREAFEDEKNEIALQREWGVLDEGQDDYDPDALDNFDSDDQVEEEPEPTPEELAAWKEWLEEPVTEVPSAQSARKEPLSHYDLIYGLQYKMGLGSNSAEDIIRAYDDSLPPLPYYDEDILRRVFPKLPSPKQDHINFNGQTEKSKPPALVYEEEFRNPVVEEAFRDLAAEEEEEYRAAEREKESGMHCANGCQNRVYPDTTVYIMTHYDSQQQIIICKACRWGFAWKHWVDTHPLRNECEDCDYDGCPSKVVAQ